jgi:hypothetical protein
MTIRLRVWSSGAFLATEHESGSPRYNVLEHDGRGRYHLVSLQESGWREADLRIDRPRLGLTVRLKVSQADRDGRLRTSWRHASNGVFSEGVTTTHPDNAVSWSQATSKPDGSTAHAVSDRAGITRTENDREGNVVSDTREQRSGATELSRRETVRTSADGGSSHSSQQTRRVPDGTISRTVTTQTDGSGQQTSQTTQVTKTADDKSVTTQTTTVDNAGGTKTDTVTHRDAGSSTSQTVVTDTSTGETVKTTNEAVTTTDAQGNTTTTTTSSVESSDGFGVTQINSTSSDGSSSYQQLTTDTQGNQTLTTSATDGQGNTTSQSVEVDAAGNTTVTTTQTDPAGNGNETVDTFDSQGNPTSSESNPVDSGSGGGSGGSGGGSGSGGSGDQGGGGGGGGDDGGGGGGGDDGGGGGDDGGGGGGDEGGGGEGGEMPSDDGTDEGPRSFTPRVSLGFATTDFGGTDGGDGDGGDFGDEGDPRITPIGDSLRSYGISADEDGWGDASPEGAVSPPEVEVYVSVPAATDDWGDIKDPRAFTGFAMSLMVAAAATTGRQAVGAVLRSLQINARLGAEVAAIEMR